MSQCVGRYGPNGWFIYFMHCTVHSGRVELALHGGVRVFLPAGYTLIFRYEYIILKKIVLFIFSSYILGHLARISGGVSGT